MASTKPKNKREERKGPGSPDKLIRLDDLIPTRDVTGGRKAVFGTVPAPKKKK